MLDNINDQRKDRQRNGFVVCTIQMVVSICGFAVGLRGYLVIDNLQSGAFWAHATLMLGSLLMLIGVAMKYEGMTWMTAGIVFNCIGIIMTFIGAIVDGMQASYVEETDFSKCAYSSESGSKVCSKYPLWLAFFKGTFLCKLKFPAHSCYCCHVQNETQCTKGTSPVPTYFAGVDSCDQVEVEYQQLMWASLGVCCVNFIIAIVACAIVGLYKSSVMYRIVPVLQPYDMNSSPFMISGASRNQLYPRQGPPAIPVPPAYEDAIQSPGPSFHPPPRRRDEDHVDGPEMPLDPIKWHHVHEKPPPYTTN